MKELFSLRILKVAWPICLGYISAGAACGVFAQKAGFTVWQIFGLSVFLYAGSGQFIGIAMLMQSASIFSIALTIFIVNLRHFLFSFTLQKFIKHKSNLFKMCFAHGITDETFAVNLTTFEKSNWTPEDAERVNIISYSTWVLSTVIGFKFAEFITIDAALASYALTAMFIGLWSFYIHIKKMLVAGLVAGVASTVFSTFVGYKLHIFLSAVFVSAVFAFIEHKGGLKDG